MSDTPTRPGELSSMEAAKIAQQIALLSRSENDRQWREYVAVEMAKINAAIARLVSDRESEKATLNRVEERLSSALRDHNRDDEARFTTQNSAIESIKEKVNIGIGIMVALQALGGFVMWLLDRVKQP